MNVFANLLTAKITHVSFFIKTCSRLLSSLQWLITGDVCDINESMMDIL